MGFELASNWLRIGQSLNSYWTIIEESPKQHHVLIINYLQKIPPISYFHSPNESILKHLYIYFIIQRPCFL